MKLPLAANLVVALALVACGASTPSTLGVDAEVTLTETPGYASASPSAVAPTPVELENAPTETARQAAATPSGPAPTPKSPENILVETPAYRGIIVSEDGASAFSYLFDQALTEFWEPSMADISDTEACISRFLVSVEQDPNAYQKEDAAYILENLGEYRRQYVGILVEDEKRIWCNLFLSEASFPDWQRVPVDVDGGGNHFWQIEYDLLNDECINFHVHGQS